MEDRNEVRRFQAVLDRVAATGRREPVEEDEVPDVLAWAKLNSRGCSIRVEGGRWWVLPPVRPHAA